MTGLTFFRSEAVSRYARSREGGMMAPAVSTRWFVLLWSSVAILLLMGLVAGWLIRVPERVPGFVAVTDEPAVDQRHPGHVTAVVLVSADDHAELRPDQRVLLRTAPTGETVVGSLIEVRQGAHPVDQARRELGLAPGMLPTGGESVGVAVAALDRSVQAPSGAALAIEIEVGTTPAISLFGVAAR